MTQFYVYLHCKPCGTPFYVGKGDRKRSRQFTKRNFMHCNITAKYGRENISVFAFPCESEAIALSDEILTIAQLRAEGFVLANFTNGGEGTTGHVKTSEQRANLSAKLKGKVRTAAQNAAQSVLQRSRIRIPEEEIARGLKIAAAHKIRVVTPEAKAAASIAMVESWKLRVRNPETEAIKSAKIKAACALRFAHPDKVAARNTKLALQEQLKFEASIGAEERRAARYAKQGAERRGKKMPPASAELCAKRVIIGLGRLMSQETKDKIAASHRAKIRDPVADSINSLKTWETRRKNSITNPTS